MPIDPAIAQLRGGEEIALDVAPPLSRSAVEPAWSGDPLSGDVHLPRRGLNDDLRIAHDYLDQLQAKSVTAVIESTLGVKPRGWNRDPIYAAMARFSYDEQRLVFPPEQFQEPEKAAELRKPLELYCNIIEHSCSELEFPLRSGIARGLVWVPDVVPEQHAVMTTDASVIVVPAYLFLFCHRIAKLLAKSFPIADAGSKIAVTLAPDPVLARIRSDRHLVKVWARSFIFFSIFERSFIAPTIELGSIEDRLELVSQLLFALEIYAISHEYGHHIAQHKLGDCAAADTLSLNAKTEELAADLYAAVISRHYGTSCTPQDFFAMSGAGGVIILMAMELLRRTRSLLGTGRETPFESDSHPSFEERIRNFERIKTLCAEQDVESFENTRRHMRDLFEGIWRLIRPGILRVRRKGVRPLPMINGCRDNHAQLEKRAPHRWDETAIMSWWDEKAARLQRGVRSDESETAQQYSEEEARRAAVHAREDMTLMVSYLSSANRLLASIRFLLIVLILVVIVIGLKLAHYW